MSALTLCLPVVFCILLIAKSADTVFPLIRAAATILFWRSEVRPLFEGGYYYKIPKKLREIAPKIDNFRHISTILVQYKPYCGRYLRAAIILIKIAQSLYPVTRFLQNQYTNFV